MKADIFKETNQVIFFKAIGDALKEVKEPAELPQSSKLKLLS